MLAGCIRQTWAQEGFLYYPGPHGHLGTPAPKGTVLPHQRVVPVGEDQSVQDSPVFFIHKSVMSAEFLIAASICQM